MDRPAGKIDFALFRPLLSEPVSSEVPEKDARPPHDAVLIFKVLVLHAKGSATSASGSGSPTGPASSASPASRPGASFPTAPASGTSGRSPARPERPGRVTAGRTTGASRRAKEPRRSGPSRSVEVVHRCVNTLIERPIAAGVPIPEDQLVIVTGTFAPEVGAGIGRRRGRSCWQVWRRKDLDRSISGRCKSASMRSRAIPSTCSPTCATTCRH
jgi:hypothetical protein